MNPYDDTDPEPPDYQAEAENAAIDRYEDARLDRELDEDSTV